MLLRHNCNNLYLRSQAFSFALCVMKGSSLNLANESFVEQMMQNAFTRGFYLFFFFQSKMDTNIIS